MTRQAQELLQAVLALPAGDRADVAAELLASLDEGPAADQKAVEAAWAREIEQRAHRVMAGESAGEAWSEVRGRLAQRLIQP